MTMATHDNAAPPPEWKPEPRQCPFADCGICESAQHALFIHGTEAHIMRGEN